MISRLDYELIGIWMNSGLFAKKSCTSDIARSRIICYGNLTGNYRNGKSPRQKNPNIALTEVCSLWVLSISMNIMDSIMLRQKKTMFTLSPDVVISADCACVMSRTKMATNRTSRAENPLADIIVCFSVDQLKPFF